MKAEPIRRALAEHGPMTRSELCRLTGLSQERVMSEVWKLRHDGCVIDQDSYYELVYDPEYERPGRTCRWPGCDETLRSSNGTGFCWPHARAEAKRRWADMSIEERLAVFEQYTDGDAEPQHIMAVIEP